MIPIPLLPPLADPEDVARLLDDPRLRVYDASVRLERAPEGGPYGVVSGRDRYVDEHVAGAAFADIAGALADPGAPHAFTLPSPERFAAGAGALGIRPGVHAVVYAQESPMWATRLWWLLRYFGFDDVSVLDGGLPAWRAARADVEAIVADGGACLLNALRPEAFRGEGPSSYSRPGRIPGSVNVPWTGLIDEHTNRFRPGPELAAALAAGGVRADEPLVAYCGGGISATVDLFALALVGRRDARLYDGSLAEWTADLALPVEIG